MLTESGAYAYSWRCVLCKATGYGGPSAYTNHYEVAHTTPTPTYLSFLREARNEHGLRGAAAYQWAHSAWNEYERNQ